VISVQGNSGVTADVDGTTFRALRVTRRAVNYGALGIYRIGARTGTLGALSSINNIFHFRWTSTTSFALVNRVQISAGITAPGAASVNPFLVLSRVSAWTVDGSGGTAITPTGNTCKLRTSMATSSVGAIRISTTGPITAGTYTADNIECGAVFMGIGTAAITTTVASPLIAPFSWFDAGAEGGMPLVLSALEGLVVRMGNINFTAGVQWAMGVNLAWAEVAAF
jgi:hypothetical protein